MKNTVILIAGPTASGKTAAAIRLAKHFHSEIISADSRQCYKELSIGVARPTEEQLAEVPHHFINEFSIQENCTAAFFENYALQKTAVLFQKNNVVVMVGGTGLYIKAFCEGLDIIPETDPVIRERIINVYSEQGISWLADELKKKDPEFAACGEMQNPQRMMRALEVMEATGQSILSFRNKEKKEREFDIIKILIDPELPVLYDQINTRADAMLAQGLLDEVRRLLPYRSLNALQTVGYRELFEFLDGTFSLEEAILKIKMNTRHYAKRQRTWFKKQEGFIRVEPEELTGNYVREIINGMNG